MWLLSSFSLSERIVCYTGVENTEPSSVLGSVSLDGFPNSPYTAARLSNFFNCGLSTPAISASFASDDMTADISSGEKSLVELTRS